MTKPMPTAGSQSALELPDVARIRAAFPALRSDLVFLENAGGSQVPQVVADAMREYMLGAYVQLDAPYPLSQRATSVVSRAHAFIERFMGAEGHGRVILGPSCTQLVTMLARCYAERLEPGDEIVIMQTAHEANAGPWAKLEALGFRVRTWCVDPESMTCPLESLDAVLGERTRVVAALHVSNLLGGINDLAPIVERAHAVGARVIVDGVAFAPHRVIDVGAWGVDWYVYSTYKVYGPHMAALYGRHEAIAELVGPNHDFIPRDAVPYKFELGGACHEGCAGLLALGSYLEYLAGLARGEHPALPAPPALDASGLPCDRATVVDALTAMEHLELPLQERIVDWLASHSDVRMVGPAHGGATRVPTISFTHARRSSAEIAESAGRQGVAIRNGHMYAQRCCGTLGIDEVDGVVRISAVHYNDRADVERLIEVLDPLL